MRARTGVGYGGFKRPQFTRDYLDEVREAALVLLYRLLFLFYAEDRNLLPVRDDRYAPTACAACAKRCATRWRRAESFPAQWAASGCT